MILESEKELEDYLCGESGPFGYFDVVTDQHFNLEFRQLALGSYGIADIVRVSFDEDHVSVQIVELKKDSLNIDALIQISKYRRGLQRFFRQIAPKSTIYVTGILVGSKVSDAKDFCYLLDQVSWLDVYVYEISMADGISFEIQEGWYLAKEDFTSLKPHYLSARKRFVKFRKEWRENEESSNVVPITGTESA